MFKLCVIGCGGISRASHGPAYRQYADEHPDFELSACCDVDGERAAALRVQVGFARAYTDFERMLEIERPNAVCLNVPVHLTAGLGRRILALGYPLLAEKPPALTVAELEPLIAASQAAAQRGVIHQVAFNRRFAPLVVALKDLLRGRELIHIEHTFTRVNRPDPDFTTTAIHGIDTLRFIAGSDYAELHMQYPRLGESGLPAFILSGHFQAGPTVHMTFQPLSGLASERSVIYTRDATFDLRLNHALDAPGQLLQYEHNQVVLALNAAELCGLGPQISGKTLNAADFRSVDYRLSGFYGEDAAFFEAVRANRQPEHTFLSARQSVAVMESLRNRASHFKTVN